MAQRRKVFYLFSLRPSILAFLFFFVVLLSSLSLFAADRPLTNFPSRFYCNLP